jgi:hypothetical protein
MANQKCRRCGDTFTPGPGDPALMEMCAECHSRKLRRATTLVLDRLAAGEPGSWTRVPFPAANAATS